MKLLFDFFPIILFFIAYKIWGIYTATAVAIFASLFQVVFYRLRYHRYEKMQLMTLAVIAGLGGATLLFHNEMFIKWKPTVINWLFGLVFYMSRFVGDKPLIQRMLEQNVVLPKLIWNRLNFIWFLFFALMGAANLFVVYNFDTNIWVDFKLFGMLGLTVIFVIMQGVYLARYVIEPDSSNKNS